MASGQETRPILAARQGLVYPYEPPFRARALGRNLYQSSRARLPSYHRRHWPFLFINTMSALTGAPERNSIREALLHELQQMQENPLTEEIIVPLLQRLNYIKVEFHGGQHEGGRDFIAWKKNSFGRMELCVGQVKRIKPVVSTRSDESFSDLINQLQQAAEKKVAHTDGKTYSPAQIIFITPYAIDQRVLLSRFEKLQELTETRNLQMIDGPELADLLLEYAGELVAKLVGRQVVIQSNLAQNLSNALLLDALKSRYPKSIGSFYCDLQFWVGRSNQASLLDCPITRSDSIELEVPVEVADRIQALDRRFETFFGGHLLLTGPDDVEQQKARQSSARYRDCFEAHFFTRAKGTPQFKYHVFLGLLADYRAGEEKNSPAFEDLKKIKAEIKDAMFFFADPSTEFELLALAAESLKVSIQTFGDWLVRAKAKDTVDVLRIIPIVIADFERFREDLERPSPIAIQTGIDVKLMRRAIESGVAWLKQRIAHFNSQEFTTNELADFILKSTDILRLTITIGDIPELCEALFVKRSELGELDCFTLKVPLNRLFDAGISACIFGDAGAGKTTTLQMYAKTRAESNPKDLCLYVPLSGVFSFEDEVRSMEPSDLDGAERALRSLLNTYFQAQVRVSFDELLEHFKGRHRAVLFDGVDEVIKKAPWILSGIGHFAESPEGIQVIMSSRQSGEYLNRIPFFAVTIRPFTDAQRDYFITKWFDKDTKQCVPQIQMHFIRHQAIAQLIRNPLLATILCVLAEHEVPLPDTEIQLYRDRTRLLLGDFDLQRRVRRVDTPDYLLLDVAERIAYRLHKGVRRWCAEADLIRLVRAEYRGDQKQNLAEKAVRELFDPCNILVPMTSDGDWGFGHLRFQEYFVACALEKHRGLKLAPLAKIPWWRGALTLFAQKVPNLDSVVADIIAAGDVSRSVATLNQMLAVRDDDDLAGLERVIERALAKEDAEDRHAMRRTSRRVTPKFDEFTDLREDAVERSRDEESA